MMETSDNWQLAELLAIEAGVCSGQVFSHPCLVNHTWSSKLLARGHCGCTFNVNKQFPYSKPSCAALL